MRIVTQYSFDPLFEPETSTDSEYITDPVGYATLKDIVSEFQRSGRILDSYKREYMSMFPSDVLFADLDPLRDRNADYIDAHKTLLNLRRKANDIRVKLMNEQDSNLKNSYINSLSDKEIIELYNKRLASSVPSNSDSSASE